MTKAELIRALEPFEDDQYVFVRLHSNIYPHGSQVDIHGVEDGLPWRPRLPDRSNFLVGLNADAENSEARILAAKAERARRDTSR